METSIRNKIMSLPKSVADRIAAGEVVERPLSIVKELVENSLDAGADSITLEIKNGGKSYIRVTDNGSGIPSDEVEIAFLRHATSKIRDDSDLLSIDTLGFRGEALASIAAVTRTQMITKVRGAASGFRISIDGGRITEKVPVGASDGTTIIVSDLFFNTPVREKFMKKDAAESSLVGDFISRLSLAYPYVRFRFINNEKTVFTTGGKGNILENIYTVYGKEMAESLIEAEACENDIRIHAYVSNPLYNKSTRKSQYFYVNGRVISDKTIESGITKAYGDKLPEGRFPAAFVFLEIPSSRVDVNIHPNKKEIRFDRPEEIENLVKNTVFQALDSRQAVGGITRATAEKLFVMKDEAEAETETLQLELDAGKKAHEKTSWQSVLQHSFGNKSKNTPERAAVWNSVAQEEAKSGNRVENPLASFTEKPAGNSGKTSMAAEQPQQKASEAPEAYHTSAPAAEPEFSIAGLRILGVVFDTYIAASDYAAFYLIDQHAAHERVFYERFLKEFYRKDPARQSILTPIMKDIPFFASDSGEDWHGFLEKSGFEVEPFGEKTWIFRAIPAFMDLSQAEGFLDDFIENLSDTADFKDKTTIDRIIMRSCKSAVKAHDKLSTEEVRALLKDLSACKNPYSCPHGRPTIVKMTEKDMEKMFRRA